VDLGHTFISGLELGAGPRWRHGEAVAFDLALSCEISRGRGLIAESEATWILGILHRLSLLQSHHTISGPSLFESYLGAGKNRNGPKAPLPMVIGKPPLEVGDISELEVRDGLLRLNDWLGVRS
jgi:2-epi-5-epi-valiolone synthase